MSMLCVVSKDFHLGSFVAITERQRNWRCMNRNPTMLFDSSSENDEPERANSSVFRNLHGLLGAKDSHKTRKVKKGSSWRKKLGNKCIKPEDLAQLRDAPTVDDRDLLTNDGGRRRIARENNEHRLTKDERHGEEEKMHVVNQSKYAKIEPKQSIAGNQQKDVEVQGRFTATNLRF
eukprot:Gb_05472 [translate_table: standard]